jgi:putative membrane protein
MKSFFAVAVCTAMLAACGERAGLPETETIGTVQSVSETSTASATTTGVTGGTSSDMAPEDKEFVSNAGMGGLAEVRMGNLAAQKATNADVKAFAQRMVTDHSKANAELQEFATTKGVALPTQLDAEHQGALDHLDGLSGAEFDKAYMQHMVEDHQKDVAEFAKASTSAADTDLRAWADRTLPTLREHLSLAREVAGKVK